MVDVYDDEPDDEPVDEGELNLQEGAAPDPVSVYERPEGADSRSATSVIITVVVLLLLLVIAYFVLQALVF